MATMYCPEDKLTQDWHSSEVELDSTYLADTFDMLGDLSLPMRRGAAETPVDVDSLDAYFNRLGHLAPLPADVQQELAVRYIEEDDRQAGKMLVLTNLRLVVKLAREYDRNRTSLLDLIQEGNVGLAQAVTRYDPHRGVKFTSYAQYWIRAMILGYLMNHALPVKVGSTRAGRKLFYNLKKTRRKLIRDGNPNPGAAEIAAYLDIDEKEVMRVAPQLDGPPVYLDAPAPGYGTTTIGQLMENQSPDPESEFGEAELRGEILSIMKSFGDGLKEPRRRAIWHERMIVDEQRTLLDLGEQFDLSKERIRQLEMELRADFKRYLLHRIDEDLTIEFIN